MPQGADIGALRRPSGWLCRTLLAPSPGGHMARSDRRDHGKTGTRGSQRCCELRSPPRRNTTEAAPGRGGVKVETGRIARTASVRTRWGTLLSNTSREVRHGP